MLEVQNKDSRSYFVLPQAPEDAGYYVYGTPGGGAGQFAHPALMSLILRVEREWAAIDDRKIGIGNISLANGAKYDKHDSHRDGMQVDVRPIRKDGRRVAVTRLDRQYDRGATWKLIELFRTYGNVKFILFNDPEIPFVKPWQDHDDHFHVALRG